VKSSDTPQARDGVLFRELDDGCVLYDPDNEKVHSLNETAGLLWCLMNGERTLAEIAGEVAEASGGDAETVLGDTLQAAEEFARQGLLV
jgi:coenzyme PQQ synthesis protein D (PqqD)